MIDIILPYLEENGLFQKAVSSIKKYTPPGAYNLVLLQDKKREGPDKMFNLGFGKTKNDVILWHTDIFALPGWYEEMVRWTNKVKAGIYGFKLVYPNGLIQHTGGAIKKDGSGYHPEAGSIDLEYNQPREVLFVTFGGCLIKREAIDSLGKIDEIYAPTYYGDVDYCFRAREQGIKIVYIPVKLIHLESKENRLNPKLEQVGQRNKKTFVWRWMHVLVKYYPKILENIQI